MSRDFVNLLSNERVDLLDFIALQRNARSDNRSGLLHFLFSNDVADAAIKRLLTPFVITEDGGGPAATIDVTPGAGLGLEILPDLTKDKGVVFGLDSTSVQVLDFTARPGATYTVYIRFVQDPGVPGARVFWDAGGAVETVDSIDTRLVVGWDVRAETSSPGDEYIPIGEVVWDTVSIDTADITHERHMYFEGDEATTFAFEWGDGGSDRAATRAVDGIHDLYTFVHFVKRQLSEIIGGGQREWEVPTTNLGQIRDINTALNERGYTTVPAITASLGSGTITIDGTGVVFTQGYLQTAAGFTDSSLATLDTLFLAYDPTTSVYALYTSWTDATASDRVPLIRVETDGGGLVDVLHFIHFSVQEWPAQLKATVADALSSRAGFTSLHGALRRMTDIRNLGAANVAIDIEIIGEATLAEEVGLTICAVPDVTIRGRSRGTSKITWSFDGPAFRFGTNSNWTFKDLLVEYTGASTAQAESAFIYSLGVCTRLSIDRCIFDLSGSAGGDLPYFISLNTGSLVDADINRVKVETTDGFVYTTGGTTNDITGTRITDCDFTGEVLRDASVGGFFYMGITGGTVVNCRIRGCRANMRGPGVRAANVDRLWITDNEFTTDSDDEVIHLGDLTNFDVGQAWVTNNLLQQSVASTTEVVLVEARDAGLNRGINISGNVIIPGDNAGTTGIVLDANTSSALAKCVVYGNMILDTDVGILMDGVDRSVVFGNVIVADDTGIDVTSNSSQIVLAANVVEAEVTDGILAAGADTVVVGNLVDVLSTCDGIHGGINSVITGNSVPAGNTGIRSGSEATITGNNVENDVIAESAEAVVTGNYIGDQVTVSNQEVTVTGNNIEGIFQIVSGDRDGTYTGNTCQSTVDMDGNASVWCGNNFHGAVDINQLTADSGKIVVGNYFDDASAMTVLDTVDQVVFVGNLVTSAFTVSADDGAYCANVFQGTFDITGTGPPRAESNVMTSNRMIGTFTDNGGLDNLYAVLTDTAAVRKLNQEI